MCDQNPLLIIPMPATRSKSGNPKGRPSKRDSIRFSTKPKSIVSQLIQKMVSQNKVMLPIERNPEETAHNYSAPTEEFDENIDSKELEQISPKLKRKEPKVYSCEFLNCTYSTKLSSNLQKHKRKHTGEKPYLCDRCSFRTSFSNSLRVHKRLHTTERPYHCTDCEYKCNSVSNLKKHSRTRHNDEDKTLSLKC